MSASDTATKAFHGLRSLFKSYILFRKTKTRLYYTIIRPVLTFGAETWSLNQRTETNLLRFENNTFISICGPIYDGELNIWRRHYTREVRDQIAMPQVTDYFRSSRHRWLGHILRSKLDRFTSRVLIENIVGRKPRERTRTRRKNVVENE
ncbi:uncharacterized protein LOC143024105 [Oratosquilla oratoria]|uniref:uncharacterized protein LOC143024105 n=1 Tax=Oratosquilla oratoria TaxID=337810 RepID=UPI003F76AF6E